jgi:ATP:ADP antiporter, AAA family
MRVLDSFRNFWALEPEARTKFIWVAVVFCLIITAYTTCKEMKDIVFSEIVGADYVPNAKILSLFVLIPAVLFYSYLVSKVRRYQLLLFYALFYGVLGLVFAYFLGHPTIGIANADADPSRLMGWLFYFFIEGYSPFLVSVAWAFSNSVFTPEEAKGSYGLLVASSKVGGVLSAGFGWYLLQPWIPLTSLAKQQILLVWPSVVILFVPVAVLYLMKRVSGNLLHGYEAAYEYQKVVEKKHKKVGMFSGLKLLIEQPYVLGIFSVIFFYEVVNAILSFLRIIYARSESIGIDEFGSKLFAMTMGYHFIGFFIALFGTNFLLRRLGERRCLVLMPVMVGILIVVFMMIGTFGAFMFAFIAIRAMNYGFFYPVRESLYIPTVKEVKFQSKAWIDAFGTKLAKGSGSKINIAARYIMSNFGLQALHMFQWAVFSVLIGCWTVVAVMLGKRYVAAIKNNEAIGAEKSLAE